MLQKKKVFFFLLLLIGSLISKYQDNFSDNSSVSVCSLGILAFAKRKQILLSPTALVKICIVPRWSKLHPSILSLIHDILLSSIFSLVT